MEDIIIIAVIAVFVLIGIKYTISHFKGKGGCCGSGDYKPKKKKLGSVAEKKIFKIEGMHCEHCSNRVMEAINDIPHVSALVDLKKDEAVVSYEEPVEDEIIVRRIEKAGYKVTEII